MKREIPTGVFITGVNLPDHDEIFSQLHRTLLKITPYISRLCSKSCPNLKMILKEAIIQIMVCDNEQISKSTPNGLNLNSRNGNPTLSTFSEWYQLMESGDEKRPVIFIFEDFECFQPSALQDFITICNLHIDDFPIILLFGISTLPDIVHKLLPYSITSCLCIEKFHAQPSITYLLEAINRIILTDDIPFKLGPQVFQFLYEHFLFHDFSLKNFIFGLKFCMMDHFYENVLSVLCSNSNYDTIREFSHQQLEIIRKLPSFRNYAERQSGEDLRKLLINDEFAVEILCEKLQEFKSYHAHFFPVLRCLSALVLKLPGFPLGKKCRDVYEHCLKTNVWELDLYQRVLKIASFISKDNLISLLEECIEQLSSASANSGEVFDNFSKYVTSLQGLLNDFEELSEVAVHFTDDRSSKLTSNVKDRFELKEKLKIAVYKRKETPFEKFRELAICSLDKMFKEHLSCPSTKVLHEIFYYDDVNIVKQRLRGCPRVAIQTALNDPHYYFNCSCCEIEADCIQDTLPDISVVFKLHLECGRLINLYDWLQAFITVIEPQLATSKKANNEKQQLLQARFIQSVSELQFLGFIKSSKRKTDHISRLTWGSC